jgi:hypothetical protein
MDKIVGVKPLPRKLFLQMDSVKDDKDCHLLTFLSSLTTQKVFEEVQLGFIVVGHTHEDIDKSFEYLSKKLKELNNYVMADFDENIHVFPRLSIHFITHSRNP